MAKYYVDINHAGIFWYNDPEKTILHRQGGPAIEWGNGNKEWFQNGQRHREDGPAIEWAKGYKAWYLNGCVMTEQDWEQAVRPVEQMTSVKSVV